MRETLHQLFLKWLKRELEGKVDEIVTDTRGNNYSKLVYSHKRITISPDFSDRATYKNYLADAFILQKGKRFFVEVVNLENIVSEYIKRPSSQNNRLILTLVVPHLPKHVTLKVYQKEDQNKHSFRGII